MAAQRGESGDLAIATYPFNIYKDWLHPASTPGKADTDWAVIVGMLPFFADANNQLDTSGTTALYQPWLAMNEDYSTGENIKGRHFHAWHTTNSFFATGGRRMTGGSANDFPDMTSMDGAVFQTDGFGRWGAGTAPFSHVFLDDGGVFTDESSDAQDPGAGDVQLLPPTPAAGDNFYIGVAATTFSGVMVHCSTALAFTSGSITLVPEYWNGAAWVTLSVTTDPADPFSDTEWGALGQYIISWTPPGDWAKVTINSQNDFWVRFNVSGVSSPVIAAQPLATLVFAIENTVGNTKGVLPGAMFFGTTPAGDNAVFRGWGMRRLEDNATAQVSASVSSGGSVPAGVMNVYYSFWDNDSSSQFGTEPVSLGAVTTTAANGTIDIVVGAHPDENVSHVEIFLEGVSGTIAAEPDREGDTLQIGVGTLRKMARYAINAGAKTITSITSNLASGQWETIDATRYGDGPYVASSLDLDELDGRPGNTAGTYISCCRFLDRLVVGGSYVFGFERRVAWSHGANPWCFPTGRHTGKNWADLPGTDDRIMSVRPCGSGLLVAMQRSLWMGTWNAGANGFSFRQIADGVGAASKRGCVTAGQRCFVLDTDTIHVVTSAGAVQEVGTSVSQWIRDATGVSLSTASGAYDHSRQIVAWGLPGTQTLLQDTNDQTSTQLNDTLLVLSLRDGSFRVWQGTGCLAATLTAYPRNDARVELASGSYWGRVHRFQYDQTQDSQAGAIQNGTVSSGGNTALTPSTGTVLNSTTDRRQLSEWLLKYNTTNGFEARLITAGDGTAFTVASAWTNNPVSGDLWWIGAYAMVAEFGDWHLGLPADSKQLERVEVHFEKAVDTANVIDAAVDNQDVAAGGTYVYSAGTINGGDTAPDIRLSLDDDAGRVQRLRLSGLINGARPVIRGLTVDLQQFDEGP